VAGAVLSSTTERLPTGPTIVLCLTGVVVVSLLLAPNRGIAWAALRERRHRRQLHTDAVLSDLYALARQHPGTEHGHSAATLEALHPGAHHELRALEARGFARRSDAGAWSITPAGAEEEERRRDEEERP